MTLIDLLSSALGGGYRVERELPPGGMSRVVIARDLTLDRDVVVKVLAGDASGLSTERFRQEIQLLARLQHPHVVPILAAGAVEEQPFYTMPFVQGESLSARIAREGALPIEQSVRILRETLDALAFAHAQGVVHRDIKPDNILLSSGHAVVADFGIAKALSAAGFATTVGVALGTPAYMAPEQALADPAADHRVDLYAVGAVAFEMLTGAAPFSGSPQQIISAHITQEPASVVSLRNDVPAELSALIAQAMAKDASARPATAAAMVAALDRILGRLASGVSPSHTTSATTAPTRRRAVIAASLVAMAAAGGGAWWLMRPTVATAARALAVMPFTVPSGDTALVRLARDLASTVSLNLDGVGELGVADPAAAIGLAAQQPQPLTTASAVSIARQLGSTSVLTGVLVRLGNDLRLDMLLRDVSDTTRVLARSTITSNSGDVAAMTDSLTWSVLRGVWQRGTVPSPSLGSVTTRSVPALRAFLEGERLWTAGDINRSDSLYRMAAQIDTTFWLAAYKYRQARNWSSRSMDTAIVNRLERNRDRLPDRERAMLTAATMPDRSSRAMAMMQLTQRYPDYAPAWMLLGDFQLHWMAFIGHDPKDALPSLRQWVALMPTDQNAWQHLGEACLDARMWRCADSVATQLKSMNTSGAPTLESGTFAMEVARAIDPSIDSAIVANTPALRLGLGQTRYNRLGMYDVRPWLAQLTQLAPPQMPAAMQRMTAIAADAIRGEWPAAAVSVAARTPASPTADPLPLLTVRGLARVVGTNTSDSTLDQALEAYVASANPTKGGRLDMQLLLLQPRLMNRDTAGLGAVQKTLAADTSYRARSFARALRAQRALAFGERFAVDSLLAFEREHGERTASYVLLTINRFLLADSIVARGRVAEADSLTRFLEIYVGASAAAWPIVGAAPVMLLQRARALEAAGNRPGALVIARAMRASLKGLTPQTVALKAAYNSMAQRIEASTDAGSATVVPGKR